MTIWGVVCLAVAVVWIYVWPEEQAARATGLRLWLIQWGHALVWLLLAIICFMQAGSRQLSRWSGLVGLFALAVYIAFLFATFVS
jgi:Ca2+/Na+ antiporter